MYDLVLREFKRSGLTQADLARRLGLGTDRICRLLGAPGNWTLDTASDLLFAISGGEPAYSVGYPLDRPASNRTVPVWLYAAVDAVPQHGLFRTVSGSRVTSSSTATSSAAFIGMQALPKSRATT
jgi:hypothetical protein